MVNDVIFPSGREAQAINLGNKNMKIGIFTSVTSVRLKNVFTDISRYPTGKHEIISWYLVSHICIKHFHAHSFDSFCPVSLSTKKFNLCHNFRMASDIAFIFP